jgi:hypothetical protein
MGEGEEERKMNPKDLTKQVIDFNKQAFDNSFHAMSSLQDQVERVVNMFLDQSPWFPEEGRKAVSEWVNAYRKGRENFKEAVDNNYKKVEDFLSK